MTKKRDNREICEVCGQAVILVYAFTRPSPTGAPHIYACPKLCTSRIEPILMASR